jgi:cysteine-rich repeat protein
LSAILGVLPLASAVVLGEGLAPIDPEGIRALQAESGATAKLSLHPATGAVRFLRVRAGSLRAATGSGSAEAKASSFLARHGRVFGLSEPRRELELAGSRVDAYGFTRLSYRQVSHGLPVFGAFLRIHFDKNGELVAVNGTVVPHLAIDPLPTLRPGAAERRAVEHVQNGLAKGPGGLAAGPLQAVGERALIFRTGLVQSVPGRNHLAFEVEVANLERTVREFVYLDAHTGVVLDQITGVEETLDRKVSETSLANVIWQDSDMDPDPIPADWMSGSADQVFAWQGEIDGARETYHLFRHMTNGGWLSFDGADATMRTVNNDPAINCPNANWNGVSTNYCNGVTADDTVAHEWGHAYTDYTHNLIYQWQPGALNESYSDIWGELVDQLNGRGTDNPGGQRSDGGCSTFAGGVPDATYRWLLGEDNTAFSGAIRDLWNPTCMGDPGKVSDSQYVCTSGDSGGVHTNSGVPNHAFALLVDGGTYNGQTVAPLGLTRAAHLFLLASTAYQGPTSDFADHADALEAACVDLTGASLYELSTGGAAPTVSASTISAADCAEVSKAIAAVEYRMAPTQCGFQPILDPGAPELCEGLGAVEPISSTNWETGLGGWTVGRRDVADPATFDGADWELVTGLPDGETGQALFADDPVQGDCVDDLEDGVRFVESPVIEIPVGSEVPHVAFDHWVATEEGFDGGNIKISVNGEPFLLIPASQFEFNPYRQNLVAAPTNTNPMAGEEAFTGTDGGRVGGSWGQSQVNLASIAGAGDSIQLRFEMGTDGCNGLFGWYVDEVQVYSCAGEDLGTHCGNSLLDIGESCDDGNTDPGDGCSAICRVEQGWFCTDPVPGPDGTNVVADSSFEEGSPNPFWLEESTNFGTPLCNASCAGPMAPDGDWYVWFGGTTFPEIGSVQQSVTIPSTASSLSFLFWVATCDSTNDFMRVLIDGNELFTTDPCTEGGGFSTATVDISAFADGGAHTLRFESETFGTNGGAANFFLDLIELSDNVQVAGDPSVCSEVSIVGVSPPSLSSAQETNETVIQPLTIENMGGADLDWLIAEADLGAVPLRVARQASPIATPEGPSASDLAAAGRRLERNPEPIPGLVAHRRTPVPAAAPMTVTITHSASQAVLSGNSIRCDGGWNSYLRVFHLADFGIFDRFDVTTVEIGIEQAEAGVGTSQEVTLNLYTLDGPLAFANLSLIGTVDVDTPDQASPVNVSIPVAGTVPAGGTLVVEVFAADATTDIFFIGSNDLGQTAPSFLAASSCGFAEPADIATLGFPDMHVVMAVTGEAGGCDVPTEVPWLSVTPDSGTVPPASSTDLDVTTDSTGLVTGVYEAKLCVLSNDPMSPLVQVPVTLTVGCGLPDDLVLDAGDNGTAALYQAKDSIIAGGGFTVGAAESVVFEAGNLIRLDNETSILGTWEARVGPVLCP